MSKFKQNPLIEDFIKNHPEFTEEVNDLLDTVEEYVSCQSTKKDNDKKEFDTMLDALELIGTTFLESLFNKTDEIAPVDDTPKKDSVTTNVTEDTPSYYGCPDDMKCEKCNFNGKCDLQEKKHCCNNESCIKNANVKPDEERTPQHLHDAMNRNCIDYLTDVITHKVIYFLTKFAEDGFVDDCDGSVYPFIQNKNMHFDKWILKFKTSFDFNHLLSTEQIQMLVNGVQEIFDKKFGLAMCKVTFSTPNISIVFGKK